MRSRRAGRNLCSRCRTKRANIGHRGTTTAEVLYYVDIDPRVDVDALSAEMERVDGMWDMDNSLEPEGYGMWHEIEVPIEADPIDEALRGVEEAASKLARRPSVQLEHVEAVNIIDHGEVWAEFEFVLTNRKGGYVDDTTAKKVARSLSGTLNDPYGAEWDIDLGYKGKREAGNKRMYSDYDVPVLGGYAEGAATDELMAAGQPNRDAIHNSIQDTLSDYLVSLYRGISGGVFLI